MCWEHLKPRFEAQQEKNISWFCPEESILFKCGISGIFCCLETISVSTKAETAYTSLSCYLRIMSKSELQIFAGFRLRNYISEKELHFRDLVNGKCWWCTREISIPSGCAFNLHTIEINYSVLNYEYLKFYLLWLLNINFLVVACCSLYIEIERLLNSYWISPLATLELITCTAQQFFTSALETFSYVSKLLTANC